MGKKELCIVLEVLPGLSTTFPGIEESLEKKIRRDLFQRKNISRIFNLFFLLFHLMANGSLFLWYAVY